LASQEERKEARNKKLEAQREREKKRTECMRAVKDPLVMNSRAVQKMNLTVAAVICDAPLNDLQLFKACHEYGSTSVTISKAATSTLGRHLWYLGEELVHRHQSWGIGGRDPQILKWGSWRGLRVVEGVVSGLLRSKGEGREPRTPRFQTRLTPLS
jgi:hypothetical protein